MPLNVSESGRNIIQFISNLYEIFEVIILGNILTEYDFSSHLASDIGLGERFISAQELDIQKNLDKTAERSDLNLMKLKESKTDYMVFSR